MSRKRVAVLISGRGSNMAALIEAAKDKTYPAEIALVLSNRADAGGLLVAHAAGIATEAVEHTQFGKDRAGFERAMQATLEKHRIEIVCLAGFMRLLTAEFVGRWQGRMLNIHPALLPAFKGLDTHKRALEAGAKVHGATVHFVVPEMDSGPIIAQGAVSVATGDTEELLAARVLKVEHRIYPLALKLLAEGRNPRREWPLPDRRQAGSGRRFSDRLALNSSQYNVNSPAGCGVYSWDATDQSGHIENWGSYVMNGRASSEPKLIFPGLAGFYSAVSDLWYPMIRIAAGGSLLFHGWGKLAAGQFTIAPSLVKYGIGPAEPLGHIVVILETIGAVCIILGLATRFFAAAIAIEMAVIAFVVKGSLGFAQMELFVLFGVIFFAIALRGGGPYSLDRMIGKEL